MRLPCLVVEEYGLLRIGVMHWGELLLRGRMSCSNWSLIREIVQFLLSNKVLGSSGLLSLPFLESSSWIWLTRFVLRPLQPRQWHEKLSSQKDEIDVKRWKDTHGPSDLNQGPENFVCAFVFRMQDYIRVQRDLNVIFPCPVLGFLTNNRT